MKQIARALWHDSTTRSSVKDEEIPTMQGYLPAKSLYSLISTGTETLVSRAEVPERLHPQMAVPYMSGDFELPIKYGYSLVAQLEETGGLVHAMHPHQGAVILQRNDFSEIPLEIPAKRATLTSNMETALNAIWDAELKLGERAIVVGFGMIGSLITRLANGIPGTTVEVFDINKRRKDYAREFGFILLEDPTEMIEPFDLAFHTSGTSEGLQLALDLVGREGRVIELSWYGNKKVELSLGGDFHSLRKKIISSQVGQIPPAMSACWDYTRRKKVVFDLLRDPGYDAHITHVVSLDEAAELFNRWRHERPEGLGYCIDYGKQMG